MPDLADTDTQTPATPPTRYLGLAPLRRETVHNDNPAPTKQADTPVSKPTDRAAPDTTSAAGTTDPSVTGGKRKQTGAPPFAPGNPGRPRGIAVGKKKVAAIKRARAVAQALGDVPPTTPDSLEWFKAILADPGQSFENKMAAAAKLLPIDAKLGDVDQGAPVEWEALNASERAECWKHLQGYLRYRDISRKRR